MRRLQPEDRFFALAVAVALVAIGVEVVRRHGGTAWSEALAAPRGEAVAPQEPESVRGPELEAELALGEEASPTTQRPASTSAEPVATGLLIVRVRALESGQPLKDYEVRVAPLDEPNAPVVPARTTDRGGSVRFEVLERTTLVARARSREDPGRTAVSGAFQVEADGVREVVLEVRTAELVPFYAYVVDPDGRPLEGVAVVTGGETVAVTDAAGGFVLEVPRGYSRSARLERDDVVPRRIDVDDEHAHPTRAARFVLRTAALLTVQVLGKLDPDLVCSWTAPETDQSETLEIEPRGGARGRSTPPEFDFGRVPADERLVVELVRGRRNGVRLRAEEVQLAPGEDGLVVLDLDSGARVFGVLANEDGSPVPGQRVYLERATGERFNLSRSSSSSYDVTHSDRDGRFEFRGVPPGPWWLGATPVPVPDGHQGWISDYEVARIGTTFELGTDETERRVDLVAYAGRSIRGRVLDPSGLPFLGEYIVAAERLETGEGFRALPFGEGEFVLEPLAPGTYRLWAGAYSDYSESEIVEVAAGADDIELVLQARRELRWTVVAGGTGESAAHVSLCRTDSGGTGTAAWSHRISYTSDGEWVAQPLPPGDYGIFVSTLDGRFGAAHATLDPWTNSSRVRVDLQTGAVLTVENGTTRRWLRLKVFARGMCVAEESCSWNWNEELVVPPGRVRIVAESDERRFEREVELEPGERRTLVLDD